MNLLKDKIILVGLPGSGKTTLGTQLAHKLGLHFVDLDHYVEKQSSTTISALFQEKGERFFRELESEMLKRILDSSEKMVLATGGGTPCFFDNMSYINQKGVSVFINESVDQILKRMDHAETGKRPKLASADLKETLQHLFDSRIKYYEQADVKWRSEEGLDSLVDQLKK